MDLLALLVLERYDRHPYLFIHLRSEKGTPFGRGLPVEVIIGSNPGRAIATSLLALLVLPNKTKH